MISQRKRPAAPQPLVPEPGPSHLEVGLVKVRTLATSVVTAAGLAAFVVASLLPELTDRLGADHPAVTIAGQTLVVLGAVIAVVRRVSPAPASTWGLTPVVVPDRLVRIVANGRFRHNGRVYEAGETYEVAPADAGYFVGVGWAVLEHTRVEPDDVIVESDAEVV